MQNHIVIFANLGSPLSPKLADVRAYLKEFLTDPYVIDLPAAVRQILVRAVIVPFRSSDTARAYRSIWTADGSPLIDWTQKLAEVVDQESNADVYFAMRYGSPNLTGFDEMLGDHDEIFLAGLYPHHADSTRTTLIENAKAVFPNTRIKVLKPFFNNPRYRQLCQDHVSEHIPHDTEHLLFSFHGLPVRQVLKADSSNSHCFQRVDCCAVPHPVHEVCYKHQCLVDAANLSRAFDGPSTVCFQSRIGKLPWLEPYTEDVLTKLASDGLKRISVYCPSFVSDNLETLYDIGETIRKQWLDMGGEELSLIPALNLNIHWVQLLTHWCDHPEEAFEEVS